MLSYLQARISERKRRLLPAGFCRHVWRRIEDPRSRTAVEASERFADGLLTQVELEEALSAAGPDEDRSHTASWISWVGGNPHTAYRRAMTAMAAWSSATGYLYGGSLFGHTVGSEREQEHLEQAFCRLLRETFGNPFRPVVIDPAWLKWNDGTILGLAQTS